jgi:hypothetical protein
MPKLRLAFVVAFLFLLLASSGFSAISNLVWSDPEIVDSPVPEVSSPSGASVLTVEDVMHVVYVKSGNVFYRARTASGWQPPEPLTTGLADARNPHLAFGVGALHVVWEDSRLGHPEVWTRRFAGSAWSAEECLSEDTVPSSGPVIAGSQGNACLVWQEGIGTAARIVSRICSAGAWQSVEAVSLGTAAAIEPSISSLSPEFDDGVYSIAWSDARHGQYEIYVRMRDWNQVGFGPEIRATDLPGNCRRPSAHCEICCGDVIDIDVHVVFENDQTGVPETWAACMMPYGGTQVLILSPNDGVPSQRPSAAGFSFLSDFPPLGGYFPRYFAAWADIPGTGARTHPMIDEPFCSPSGQSETISQLGLSACVVSASEGTPFAPINALWVEEHDGQPALMLRRGTLPGCQYLEVQAGPIILAPEGFPADTVQLINDCTSLPLQGDVELRFDNVLDAALAWHPGQPHPIIPRQHTDPQGRVTYSILGGGCSSAGWVYIMIDGVALWGVQGAKSPDVNGDCLVGQDDLTYVESKTGTSDFCADLDGSGAVDRADVAIVQATLGDLCSHLVGLDPADGTTRLPALQVSPNPCRERALLKLALPAAGLVHAGIFDVAGRAIRDFTISGQAGVTLLNWDLQDQAGNRVPDGIYWAIARVNGARLQRPIVVLR